VYRKEKKNISLRILMGKPNEKCLFKDRIIWEYNIKMDLKKEGCEKVNGTKLCDSPAQLQDFLLAVLNLQILLPESELVILNK
jgi:hypothetical protein